MFIHWGKHGTSSAGLTNAYAVALSMGLRHRVPLPELIRPGLDQDFGPNGRTDDPEIPRVRSAVDYVARRLAIDWLPYADRAALGVFTRTERVRHRQPGAGHPALPRRTRQQPGDHHLENFGPASHAAFVGDDAPQVRARPGGAAIQEVLQASDFVRCLQHEPIRPQATVIDSKVKPQIYRLLAR